MSFLKNTVLLQHCLSFLSGIGAFLFFSYSVLLQLSNAIALQEPDGFPFDPEWKIYGGFTLSVILIVLSLLITDKSK